MNATIRVFDTKIDMFSRLGDVIENDLRTAVSKNGKASYVATGGSTVPPLLHNLSRKTLPWEHISVTLSDDRWVNPSQSNSNQNLIETNLLANNAAKTTLIPLWSDTQCAEQAADLAHESLSTMSLPFDVTLLGMGEDLHIASLLPNADGLKAAMAQNNERLVCTLTPNTDEGEKDKRLSLSLNALLHSRAIFIVITGAKKWHALSKALMQTNSLKYPACAIVQNKKSPVHIYWSKEA